MISWDDREIFEGAAEAVVYTLVAIHRGDFDDAEQEHYLAIEAFWDALFLVVGYSDD